MLSAVEGCDYYDDIDWRINRTPLNLPSNEEDWVFVRCKRTRSRVGFFIKLSLELRCCSSEILESKKRVSAELKEAFGGGNRAPSREHAF